VAQLCHNIFFSSKKNQKYFHMATSKNKKDSRSEDNETTFSANQNNGEENSKTRESDSKKVTASANNSEKGSKQQKNGQGKKEEETGRLSGKSGTSDRNTSQSWSAGTNGEGFQGNTSDGNGQQFEAQEEEQGYSRKWDTLNNDQYGQMTQGSYNPRNNQGFEDERGDRNYRSNRSMYNEYGRDDNRRGRDDDRQGYQNRSQEWGSSRNAPSEGRSRHNSQGQDQWSDQRRNYGEDRSRDRYNDNNYGTRQYDPSERYGSHWRTGNQDLYRNQGGHYSDYENPPFDRGEYREHPTGERNSRNDHNRQYDNFGSEYDNRFEGSGMRDRDQDRDSARERGWSRGYQYGTDSYNSGSSQDNPRGYRPYGSDNDNRGRDSQDSYSSRSRYSENRGDERSYRDDRDDRGRDERRSRSDRNRNRR
jgi:hypothetical protein